MPLPYSRTGTGLYGCSGVLAEILVDVSGYKLQYTEAVQADIVSHCCQVFHMSTEHCITGMAFIQEGKTHYVGCVLHALDGMLANNYILFVAGYCIFFFIVRCLAQWQVWWETLQEPVSTQAGRCCVQAD